MKRPEDICSEIKKEIFKDYIPMSPEIVQTSSFYYPTYDDFIKVADDEKNHYVYTRGNNPTTEILEKKLAQLECGEKCKVFSSGMGGISSVFFTLLSRGDHILMINTVYGEAVSLVSYMEKFGITYDRIDVETTQDIEWHIKENTKLIYFESPSSQKFELLDLELISSIAKKKNIYTIIDGTWASPIFQKPLQHGIDLVIHSLSKYIGGHSDLVGGAVIGDNYLVDEIFEHGHQSLGATISPFNSWLALRGLRTLPVRMKQLDESVRIVIDAIKDDERIAKIFHPYCGDTSQKDLSKQYLSGYGSLLAIDLATQNFEKLLRFVNSLEVVSIGVSWGGFESLALPAFKGNNSEKLAERGLSPSHIRLYIGLEHPESIINDIRQALDQAFE
ncbi:aminotransferase class I/II-fold pyridoxal phosphate-dependent enzyme [Vagococcus elongatus]|uniref:homocysteine desulfhydrase n=1 Tax=Vagococcus elongatus TaxID=180344 RepID=A0A430B428_9ENTE|nr:aminotransferase class I/II-fold pyridoxal phosphate-dependent enzyme [Vagococcus elongatus]RSU15090.1 cystathionine gamma-synthase [Vagococcus elongatus]